MRTLIAALAAASGILAVGGGPANASTIAAASHSTHIQHGMTADAGTGPVQLCVQGQTNCDYDSGWMTYGDGGCEVDTVVDFNTTDNTMTVVVDVRSPYLFAGCTAVSTVNFQYFYWDLTYSSAGFWGYACSETDFTCKAPHADPGTWGYGPTATGVPASLASSISGIWVTDTT
jgi:hypothetical protein